MVLCSRCQLSEPMRPCAVEGRKPCLVCQEDIELERTIQELQDKRRILRTRMNASHDPFHFKFPPEITSLIFSLSTRKEDYESDFSTLRKLPTPFLLGSVSRSWRQLARSTPQLWSTISFTLVKQTTNALAPLQFINDWLQLSENLPLTLCIFEGARSNLHWKTCPPVVGALNQHSGRWHNVVFHLDIKYLRHFRGTDSPSNLYDLEIINEEGWDMHDSPPAYFSMISKPSPVHLTIDGLLLSGISISWSNITCITLRQIPAQECVEAFKLTPLLESCTLSDLEDDSDDFWPPQLSPQPIFSHIHLCKLFLSGTQAQTLVGFIDVVEFPSLEELSYKLNYDITKKGLIPLLKRSGNRLKSLTLLVDSDSGMYSMIDIFKMLSRAPPIRSGGIPGLLSGLQSLVIYSHCTISGSVWECIPDIFHWTHRKLLTLKFEAMGSLNIHSSDLDKTSQLVNEGFDIRIFERGQDYLQKIRAERPSLANPPT